MPTIKPAVMQRHLQSLSEGSACLWKDTSVCRGLFQPNNQPIHPNDCSIQDKLTHPSHNRTLQMTLFNQENRFVLFLKTNESHFGCRGLSCVLLSANKSTGIARRLKRLCLPSVSHGLYQNTKEGSHSTTDRAATVRSSTLLRLFLSSSP